jgi:uncharacterized membrane protein
MAEDSPALPHPASALDELDPILGRHPPERRRLIERLRLLNIVSLLGLIVLGLAWELWLAPLKGGTGALAIKVLPLTLGIAGLFKHKLYTSRWLSMLVLLYFTEGVLRATTEQGASRILAIAEVVLSVVLFSGCAVYVRQRLKVLPPKAKGAGKGSGKGDTPGLGDKPAASA